MRFRVKGKCDKNPVCANSSPGPAAYRRVYGERYTNPMPYTVAGTGLFRLLSRAV
jgi:hypothetical protein